MQSRNPATLALTLAAICFSWSATAQNQWGVIGAGNATCVHWSSASEPKRTEILSWMAGFASAESLDRAAAGKAELRLEMLTYQYLQQQITTACAKEGKEQTMSSILFGVLKDFPTRQ